MVWGKQRCEWRTELEKEVRVLRLFLSFRTTYVACVMIVT